MSQPSARPPHYEVICSARVLNELKALAQRATARGLRHQVLNAIKEIIRLLEVYPQFGQPIQDLSTGDMIWMGVVAPLIVRYSIDEKRRRVHIVRPFKSLPKSGL